MAHNRELSQFANVVGHNGGKVGINTTNPTARLEIVDSKIKTWTPTTQTELLVERNGNCLVSIIGKNDSNTVLNFGDSDDENAGAIDYDHDDDSMGFRVNGAERLNLSSTGRISQISNNEDIDMDANASGQLKLDGNGYNAGLALNAEGLNIYTNSASRGIIFGTNETERVRLTSAGSVGIGTDTPGAILEVFDHTSNTILNVKSGDAGAVLNLIDDSARSSIEQNGTTLKISSDTGAEDADSDIRLQVDGSTKMLVNSSGFVGINETSPSTHLHVEQDNAHSSTYYLNADAAILVDNKNASGKSTIKLEGEAAFVYGAGTSSLVIADRQNERLHIDSSGRVLIGGTSARTNFNNGTASPQIQIENVANGNKSSIALIHNENALSDSSSLHFAKTRGGTVGDDSALNQAGDRLGQIVFSGHDGSEFVQAATIEGLTDASPGNNDMPGRLSFSVTHDGASSPVERMRINRKGFLKMGPRITDSNHGVADLDSVRHEFTSDDNGWTIIVTHTSGAASEHEGILIDYNLDPNGTGNSFLQGNAGNNTRFRMASNGGLYNYQSNNSNLSDEREKKNIVSLDTKWDKVKSWELKKFHYNEDADSDDLRYGVIAQQVEQHCPEVLTEWIKQSAKDAVLDENENVVTPAVPEITRKGVKEQQMMWMAIKALQEAQTRIETLETQNADLLARVTALEGS